MSVLAQLVSRIPGLDDYNDQVKANTAQSGANLNQTGALQTILTNLRQAPLKDELLTAQVAEHKANAKKKEMEAAFNAEFMKAGGEKLGPDQLDAFATKAAMLNHSGAVGLARLAELKRSQALASETMGGMRSQVVADAPAATEADAVARINAGGGKPMSIGIGDNPNIIPRKEGGVAAYLMDSPYVGTAAKALQDRIDAGQIRDPKAVESWIKGLNDKHIAQVGAQAGRDQRPVPPEPLEAVYGPDGKTPTLVPRSQAAGMRPYRVSADAGGAADTPGDYSKAGEDFLASLPEADRAIVKKIASYELDPKTLSTKGGHRERVLSLVSKYEPLYDDTQYANKRRAIAQFGTGPQGNTVRSLNVAIEHIDTLGRAADALKNGDFTPGNKTWNEFAKVFGQSPPNTFEAMRDIVANEVVKGTIGATNALADRQEAASKVKASASPEQLKDLMNGWTELMGGQVKGLRQQYEGSTGLKDFDERYLRPRTRDAIALAESNATGSVPEFATEADAAKANLKPGTKVKIGGRTGTWQ